MHAAVSIRELAVAAPKVWIAVRGRLDARSLAALREDLTQRSLRGQRELYLDLAEVTCASDVVAGVPADLLPAQGARVHVIQTPPCLAPLLTWDHPCLIVHHHRRDAWAAWSHETSRTDASAR
ncbi:hypothetical protein [Streptomyces sp. SYP-A7185]|uniref:hypothetical protein n=1 Tax=Streptomyces sp. SYP-A7185 TaxID=3040076 RepID=UPI0038F5DC93